MKQTHHRLITALMLAGLLTPAMVLTGCVEGGGTSASISAPAAAKANVGISVEFPPAGASAARIDDNATAILVEVWDITAQQCEGDYCYYPGNPTKSVTLERPVNGGPVTASLLGVTPGEAWVRVTQLSGGVDARTVLETANVAAKLVEGQNNMTVTLIRAAWTLQTPVTFNKTLANDTTRLDSFSVVPESYNQPQLEAAATSNVDIYGTMQFGSTGYGVILKGANLCSQDDYGGYGGTGGTITCGQAQLADRYHGLGYFNRHDSSNTSKNFSLLSGSGDLPLTRDGQERERGWFAVSVLEEVVLGSDTSSSGETLSDPDVFNDFKIAVTGGSTIQGNFIEFLEKSRVASNRVCYTYDNASSPAVKTTISCPAQVSAAKASAQRGKAFRAALLRGMAKAKAGPAKAAADAQGCYLNLAATYKDAGMYGGYANQQYWYYDEDVVETMDVCRHPFTATASQLSQTDIDLVNSGQGATPQRAARR